MTKFRSIVLILFFVFPTLTTGNAIETINLGLEAANQGNLQLAEKRYTAAIQSGELSGNSLAYAYRVRGNMHYGNAKYDQAIDDFGKAIELNPNDEVALNNRGSTWFVVGEFDKAVSDYSRSLQINPNKAQIFHNRSLIYFEQKKYALSIEDSNKSLALNESNMDAFINRGSAWFALGNLDNAIRDYSAALNINPTYANAYYNRSVVFAELKKFDDALGDIDQAIYYNPEDPGVYAHRAQLWKTLNQIEKSKIDYQTALTYADKYGESYRHILQSELAGLNADNLILSISEAPAASAAISGGSKSKETDAILEINQKLLDSPEDSALLKKRGWLYFYNDQLQEALTDFKRVLNSNPQDIYRLLWIYIVSGHQQADPQQAIQSLAANRNLDKWPGPLVRYYLGQIDEPALFDMISTFNTGKSVEEIASANCEAFYYVGEYYLNLGEIDQAKTWFKKALNTGKTNFTEYKNARFQLDRL